jgi:GT2 family glycosyltransferase
VAKADEREGHESGTPVGRADPRVSLVVVTYNSMPFLPRLVQALRLQSYRDREVVVFDNASSDGSPEFVAAQMPEAVLLRSDRNLGYASGNNAAFARCHGRYVAILNPDTEPQPGWLGGLVAALDADPAIGLATSRIVLDSDRDRINACGMDVHIAGFTTCRGLGEAADRHGSPAEVAAVSGAAFIIRRDLLERIGGFDDEFFMYMEDTDLSWRALLTGTRCRYVPDSVVAHRYALSVPAEKLFLLERNRLQMVLKCYRFRTLICLAPALALAELASWIYAALHGPAHLRAKARALAWVSGHWTDLMRRRRRVQAERAAGDGTLLSRATYRLPIAVVRPGGLSRAVETCASAPFALFRRAALAIDRG